MVQGRVKWFNAKAGYGFATNLEGGGDVFVHHSGLKVTKEQFRYLVEGEYIEMEITEKEGKSTGTEVTGIRGGKLMCETRSESTGGGASGTEKKKPNVMQQLKYKPKAEL
jgi:CspA family cold shock protein